MHLVELGRQRRMLGGQALGALVLVAELRLDLRKQALLVGEQGLLAGQAALDDAGRSTALHQFGGQCASVHAGQGRLGLGVTLPEAFDLGRQLRQPLSHLIGRIRERALLAGGCGQPLLAALDLLCDLGCLAL